jgi:stage IV sporulation protein FB
LFLTAALLYLDGQGLVLQGALVCALHELGHWGAIALLGGRVRALRLTAVGAEMELDSARGLSYPKEVLAALAGPAVNLLLAWLCARGGRYVPAGMNLCFGLLNLLPIRPLDGGRALFCALAGRWPTLAERVLEGSSLALAGGLLGVGLAAWRSWGNLSLLVTAVWLLAGALRGTESPSPRGSLRGAQRRGNP